MIETEQQIKRNEFMAIIGTRPCSLVGVAEFLRNAERMPENRGIILRNPLTVEYDYSPPITPEEKKQRAVQRRLQSIAEKQVREEQRLRRRRKYYEKINV